MQREPMQPLFKCLKGFKAYAVCAFSKCQHENIFICDDSQCQCQQSHDACMTYSLKILWKQLETKGDSHVLNQKEVYELYERQLQMLKFELFALSKNMEKSENQSQKVLFGEQKQLYDILEAENKNQINSRLVSSVVNSINKNPRYQNIDTCLRNFQNSLQQIAEKTKIIKQSDLDYFNLYNVKFDPDLRHRLLVINKPRQVTAPRKEQNCGLWKAALLSPSLFKRVFRVYKFEFIIIKCSSWGLMFGICQLYPDFDIKKDNSLKNLQCGAFTSHYDVKLGRMEGHQFLRGGINLYQRGDIVEVQYQTIKQIVKVTNVKKGTSSECIIPTNYDIPLHVGVLLEHHQDCVRLISVDVI